MNASSPGDPHRAVLDRFPAALKALVEAELRAGNTIVRSGGGHPAPPAGDLIMLAEDLRTRQKNAADGLHYFERNSSLHHQEVTDEQRFFWVLTAPLPPPPEPDMDAIREAADRASAPVAAPVPTAYPPGSIELDYRGEMLILHEAERRTDIVWTWNRSNQVHRSSISPWWYPKERRSQPMTEEEKADVLHRFLDFAHMHIGKDIEVRD